MQRTQAKTTTATKAKTQARTTSVKKVPVPARTVPVPAKRTVPVPAKAVPVPTKPAAKNQEESKVAADALHYCTVGPMTDYSEILAHKNLEFVGSERTLQVKGMPGPLPKMD